MTTPNLPEPVPMQPLAPPTQPAPLVAAARTPNWPTVLGVIAIVLGSLGALGGLCGVFAPLFTDAIMKLTPGNQAQQAGMQAIEGLAPYTMTMAGLSCLVAIILLTAGIKLQRRNPSAPRLCVTWAWIKIVVVLATVALQAMVQYAQWQTMLQQPHMPPGFPMASFATAMSIFTVIIGLLWGWALPIFMLIWFSRPRIKAQIILWT